MTNMTMMMRMIKRIMMMTMMMMMKSNLITTYLFSRWFEIFQ